MQPAAASCDRQTARAGETISRQSLKLVRRHLAGAAILQKLIIHLLAFTQVMHARALDGADVNEHILTAIDRLNEAEALLPIEPLHNTFGHRHLLTQPDCGMPAAPRIGAPSTDFSNWGRSHQGPGAKRGAGSWRFSLNLLQQLALVIAVVKAISKNDASPQAMAAVIAA
jgi:hypothetical protein